MSSPTPACYYSTHFLPVEHPLPSTFAILTAHNPMDRKRSPRLNQSADHRLKRLLARKQFTCFRVTGCSPDQAHAEAGWGIVTDLPAALLLARRFHQRAIWWVTNDRLHLVDCRQGDPEFVDLFSARLLPTMTRNSQ